MRTVLRTLAVLCAIFVVILLILGLVTLSLRTTLLTPSFWEQVLVRREVYSQLSGVILDGMFAQAGRSGEGAEAVAELERKFGRPALKEFLNSITPPAWIQEQVEGNVGAMFAYLRGETDYPELRLDLGEVAMRIEGEEGRAAVRRLLGRLPPCGPEEDFLQGEYGPGCRPPDPALDEAMDEFLPQLVEEVPEDLSFQGALEAGAVEPELLQFLVILRQAYRLFSISTWATWLIGLVLLGLMLLMAARGWDQALRWTGWPLLVAGGLVLLGMGAGFLSSPFLVAYGINRLISNPALPRVFLSLTGSVLQGVVRGVTTRGMVLSGGVALLGLVLLIVAAVIRSPRQERDF